MLRIPCLAQGAQYGNWGAWRPAVLGHSDPAARLLNAATVRASYIPDKESDAQMFLG